MKGAAPAPQLSTEIQPAYNIPAGVEELFVHGWLQAGGAILQAAGVGQSSDFRFRNPLANNVIAVIEQLTTIMSVAGDLNQNVATAVNTVDLAVTSTGVPIDLRWITSGATGQRAASILSQTNNGAMVGTSIGRRSHAANVSVEWINYDWQQMVVAPGGCVEFTTAIQNVQLIVCVRWRERFIEESERR